MKIQKVLTVVWFAAFVVARLLLIESYVHTTRNGVKSPARRGPLGRAPTCRRCLCHSLAAGDDVLVPPLYAARSVMEGRTFSRTAGDCLCRTVQHDHSISTRTHAPVAH